MTAPRAARRPVVREMHGVCEVDEYAWLRDARTPEALAYLAAERRHYDEWSGRLSDLRERLTGELRGRIPPAGESVSWRQGGHAYFTRYPPGKDYPLFLRTDGAAEELLLDENEPAGAGGYVALGVREVSPDGRLLAYSVDVEGDEVYELRIRDLTTGTDRAERLAHTYYGLAWSAASDAFLYVVHDTLYRPYQVWLHRVGTGQDADTLVHQEDDERFEVTVRATRSGAYLLIETASRDTTETLLVPSGRPDRPPEVIEPRRRGVEYTVDHGGDLFMVTNAGAVEFRLVGGRPGAWTELVPGSAGTRLVGCDVFAGHLVVTERHGGATRLRVIDRATGAQRFVDAGGPERSLGLGENREYATGTVTIRVESLIEPPAWYDLDLATGEWSLRKRAEVPTYDAGRYVSERIHATAADGERVPVTVAYRRGLPRDGTAPCLLYSYGAYESCAWPAFDVGVPSLLDRGFVYAVAHPRGGGELGRRWWLDGRLDRKKNTFTDVIAAAGHLTGTGLAGPIVTRGLSAGGLLQGALYSMAPERWRAVVAEVPYVDCVTSMLDPGIPLTVNEWDEWGDPRDPAMFRSIRSYTPYENVPADPRPPLLVTGSLHDPRVLIHEPAKWVARLRATGTGLVLFRAELGAGAHIGPAGRYDRLHYEAEILAFILHSVDL